MAPAASYTLVELENEDVMIVAERRGAQASMIVRDSSPVDGQWRSPANLPAGVGDPIGAAGGNALERPLSVLVRDGPEGQRVLRVDTADEAGTWRAGPPAPEGVTLDGHPVVSPDHLISASMLVAYDLLHDRWQRLPTPRQADRIVFDGPNWWFEGRLYLMGNYTDEPDSVVEVFTPHLPRWLVSNRSGRMATPAAAALLSG